MWIGGYVQFDTGNIWFDNEDGDMFEYTQAEFPLMQYTGLVIDTNKPLDIAAQGFMFYQADCFMLTRIASNLVQVFQD